MTTSDADPSDTPELPETLQLIRRWRDGDEKALQDLLRRHLDEVRRLVEGSVGHILKQKGDNEDYVQEAVIDVLRYLPAFRISQDSSFRAFLARIVSNVIRDQGDWHSALRRHGARVTPLHDDPVLDLDPPRDEVTTPSRIAQRNESVAWVRVAMALLPADDRTVIVMREWQGLSHAAIGARFGTSEDAARKRHTRAVARLLGQINHLRAHGVDQARLALYEDPPIADGGPAHPV